MTRSNNMQTDLLNEWALNAAKLSFFWKRGGGSYGSGKLNYDAVL